MAKFSVNAKGHRQYENESDARAYATERERSYGQNVGAPEVQTKIQQLTQMFTAPKAQVQAAAPAASGGGAGPGDSSKAEIPGGGGAGGSVSYEGYEPTMRSTLNPNIGRRLMPQALSALSSVRNHIY